VGSAARGFGQRHTDESENGIESSVEGCDLTDAAFSLKDGDECIIEIQPGSKALPVVARLSCGDRQKWFIKILSNPPDTNSYGLSGNCRKLRKTALRARNS
jgi:hypothetical protein